MIKQMLKYFFWVLGFSIVALWCCGFVVAIVGQIVYTVCGSEIAYVVLSIMVLIIFPLTGLFFVWVAFDDVMGTTKSEWFQANAVSYNKMAAKFSLALIPIFVAVILLEIFATSHILGTGDRMFVISCECAYVLYWIVCVIYCRKALIKTENHEIKCQKCGCVFCYREIEKKDEKSYSETEEATHSNTESVKTGTVYSGSTKIGDVYGSRTTYYDVKRTITTTSYKSVRECAHCGERVEKEITKREEGDWKRV